MIQIESINSLCAGFGLGLLLCSLSVSVLSFYHLSK